MSKFNHFVAVLIPLIVWLLLNAIPKRTELEMWARAFIKGFIM